MDEHAPHEATVDQATSPTRDAKTLTTRIEDLIIEGRAVALYLDVDGTLLDVALTPSSVHVPPQLAALLTSLSIALDGALAIVTGRQIEDADALLAPFRSSAAGVHGAETRRNAHDAIISLSPKLDEEIAASIRGIVARMPGIMLEDKGSGLTLHYRLAPERRPELLHALRDLLPRHQGQFTLCGGRKVIEVLPVGFSKGRALRHFFDMPPFAGRTPVMIGDDVSDEAAIAAAQSVGGFGLKVAGENFSIEEAHFASPRDVLAWLERLEIILRQAKSADRRHASGA